MYDFIIPSTNDNNILFEAILESSSIINDTLGKNICKNESEIKTLLGKQNRVAVGVPVYENLIQRLLDQKQEIPNEIKNMISNYDFHFVSFCCSFLPDKACRFTWARFGVELKAVSRKTGKVLKEKPVAIDIVPNEVLSELKYKRETSFIDNLRIKIKMIDADMQNKLSNSREVILYEPEVIAYGMNASNIAWDFKETSSKGIWGIKKDLITIIRTPKDSKLKGKFNIGAEVVENFIKIPMRKKENEVVNIEYDLSK